MDFADENKRRVAFHEAGHAWMMWKEGLEVARVSMEPLTSVRRDNRGETVSVQVMEENRKELSVKFAKAALAGSEAEHFLLGKWDEESLQARAFDMGRARSFMVMSGDDWKPEALDHFVQTMSNMVTEEISRPRVWDAITALAYELLVSGTLTGGRIREILSVG